MISCYKYNQKYIIEQIDFQKKLPQPTSISPHCISTIIDIILHFPIVHPLPESIAAHS